MAPRSRTPAPRRRRRFLASTVLLAAVAATAVALYLDRHESTHTDRPVTDESTGTAVPDTQQAHTDLDRLAVARNRNWESYERNAFGPGWSGRGGEPKLSDGCTAREDVMKRDLTDVRLGESNSCLALSGTLHDPYTGAQLPYNRFKASDIEIDHVVALGDAWRSGASEWNADQRQKFANDVGNLLAVQKQANQDKGSKTPDQWKPRQEYWCDYARRWIGVKTRWSLTVQPTEKAALSDMLAACGPVPGR
ncbi:HNH endonuclease family protein [Nocardia sp. NPDC020380]|uniref:HNH endonuclease family protein n=1 Tax=Nocardia sp. NPDC020380 TaxID=3364309 RepID=UPI0037A5F36B